jgi:hypothetical protein
MPRHIDMASDTKQSNAISKKQRPASGVREEERRGKRYLVIDFRYRIPDGSPKGKSARGTSTSGAWPRSP